MTHLTIADLWVKSLFTEQQKFSLHLSWRSYTHFPSHTGRTQILA